MQKNHPFDEREIADRPYLRNAGVGSIGPVDHVGRLISLWKVVAGSDVYWLLEAKERVPVHVSILSKDRETLGC